jgi:hypothetical protein
MTTPPAPGSSGADQPPPEDVPFNPYRFGLPDHPIPPEYAPPGYVPPPPPPTTDPYAQPYGTGRYPTPYGGAPAPPMYSGYHQPKAGSGRAITSLVLGVVSLALFWTSFLDALFAVPAIVLGIVCLNDPRLRVTGGRGLAIAGLVCGALGAIAAIAFTALIVHAANKCGGLDNRNAPGFNECVQRHL